jgi:hypothetical protein
LLQIRDGKIKQGNSEMKKLMVAALVASCVGFAFADSGLPENNQADSKVEGEVLEEEKDFPLEAGFDLDIFTSYVYRNQIMNDRPVAQPCVWADWSFTDSLWAGFYVWQNYDLTNRRRSEMRGEWNETDYNIHLGSTIWSNEEETMDLELEVGHEWFTCLVKSEEKENYPSTCEIYVKATFHNPLVNIYGQVSRMYRCWDGTHYEAGLNKTFSLVEEMPIGQSLELELDWNVNFGSGKYLDYLYGVGRYYYEIEDGDDYDCGFENGNRDGIGGTTIKATLSWALNDNISVGGVLAYTSLLNGSIRGAYDDDGWDYKDDLVWGGFQVSLSF